MKGKIVMDKDGTLKVATEQREIDSRVVKSSSLIKKAKNLLDDISSERKELKKRVLAMIGIRKKLSEDDATEKETKKVEKSVDNQINIVDDIISKLTEMFKKLLEVKDSDVVSDDEKREIKKLLEEAEDVDLDTQEEMDGAEKELLEGIDTDEGKAASTNKEVKTAEDKEEDKEDKENKKEEEEEDKKESKKEADIVKTKEDAKTVIEKSNTVSQDKEKLQAEVDLASTEEEVKNVVEKSNAIASSKKDSKVARILRRIKMRRMAKRRNPKRAADELSSRFMYNDAGVKKNYNAKDVEAEAARKETSENDKSLKELKRMDRGFLTKGYDSPGSAKSTKASLELTKRKVGNQIERSFDLAAEKQFKELISNPLKIALVNNLGEDAISLIEKSFVEASEETFDVMKNEAKKLSSLGIREFVKEAKLVRNELPTSMEAENKSIPIKTASVGEGNMYKTFFQSKKDRELGAII